jgi:hypothetical protein
MKDCLEVTVAGLVLLLQDRDSYEVLLAYRGPDAQTLLDLFQDVGKSSLMQLPNNTYLVSGSRFFFTRQASDMEGLMASIS